MATIITSECINCGACEAECPNTAIYQGGAEWELDGAKHPALAADTFYIVKEKCTECVGFFDHEACAAVCPVDCCIPDPNNPETEDALLARAKQLHADKAFGAGFPSRFRKAGAKQSPEPAAEAVEAAAPAPKAPELTKPPAPPTPATEAPQATPPQAAAPASPPSTKKTPEPTKPAPVSTPTEVASQRGGTTAEEAPSGVPGIEEWDIPIECFRCGRGYSVTYKYFRSGAVLYCPSCHGSYVVTTTLYGYVSRAVREFHARWREQFARVQTDGPKDLKEFEERRRQQLEAFNRSLQQASRDIRAPGAPRKRARIFG